MEDYKIKNLYMSANHLYEWQETVEISARNTIVVDAPRKSGKTFMCRDIAMDFINSGDPGENALYFSPRKGEGSRLAHTVEVLLNRKSVECNYTRNKTYIVEDENYDTALYVPTTHEALAQVLSSGTKFGTIIIDDADEMHSTLLWTAIFKAKVDDAQLIVVGNPTFSDESSQKDIMLWLMNHPCADSYRVHRAPLCFNTAPELLVKSTEEFMNRIREMMKPVETVVA